MSKSLKKQAMRGAFLVGVERVGMQLVQVVVMILLARQLAPAEFGLLAMIQIFTSSSVLLASGGFATALIQKKNITHTDESTAFWFNVGVSILAVSVLCLLAPMIASFYDQPRLVGIIRWCSVAVLFNGGSVVQYALLQKNVRFGIRLIASITAVSIAGTVALMMAFNGFGVWSLVANLLIFNIMRVVIVWVLYRWRPRLEFSFESLKSLITFGANVQGYALLNAAYENLYAVVIGKMYLASDLGFYYRAKRFGFLFSFTPVKIISEVHFPYLCKIQDDPDQMHVDFKRVVQMSIMIIFPALAGLAITAPDFITVVVGEKWLPSVPYLQIFCGTGFFYVLYILNIDVLKALGRIKSVLHFELGKFLFLCSSVVILLPFGIKALLYGELVCSAMFFVFIAMKTAQHIGAGPWIQLMAISRYFTGTFLMSVCLFSLELEGLTPIVRFSAHVPIAIIVYGIILFILKDPVLLNGMQVLIKKLRSNSH